MVLFVYSLFVTEHSFSFIKAYHTKLYINYTGHD